MSLRPGGSPTHKYAMRTRSHRQEQILVLKQGTPAIASAMDAVCCEKFMETPIFTDAIQIVIGDLGIRDRNPDRFGLTAVARF
jgi:hypothetical protein